MFIEELGYPQKGPTPLTLDNEAVIKLSKNKILTGRTKTIQRKENYVREMHLPCRCSSLWLGFGRIPSRRHYDQMPTQGAVPVPSEQAIGC